MSDTTLSAIANQLVDCCRTQRELEALDTLYAPDAVSVEATAEPGGERETRGREGIRGKHAWWAENFEVHGGELDGPYLHGDDRFGVIFEIDATHKPSGERHKMKEIGIYTVSNGKISREEFYYTM
ncbi:MAG: nuclear transport factor 2 family protein [Alphaproteobacteria bacterium]|nr:MAG: nuclear transport factor 2 family protein [Alphaproteobacteria bacterium]